MCVSAFPDVQVRDVTSDWEFVVMACDGIWDVMTNEVPIIKTILRQILYLTKTCLGVGIVFDTLHW